jgi:hypothetical protein
MLALAARAVVPLLIFALFLLVAWVLQDHAERRDARPQDPPADETEAPESEPPREVPMAA